VNRRTL